MAFCPNCGTPNTEQAAKCVNCGNALAPPTGGGGGKFKGTIMMGAVSPGGPGAPQPGPTPAPQPQAQQPQPEAKNLAFQKTMLGGMAAPPPSAPAPAAPPDPAPVHSDLATAATVEQTSPLAGGGFSAPSSAPNSDRAQAGFDRYSEEPALPQSNATKMMVAVLGVAVLLAALIVGAALMMRDGGDEAEPAEAAEPAETSSLRAPRTSSGLLARRA